MSKLNGTNEPPNKFLANQDYAGELIIKSIFPRHREGILFNLFAALQEAWTLGTVLPQEHFNERQCGAGLAPEHLL